MLPLERLLAVGLRWLAFVGDTPAGRRQGPVPDAEPSFAETLADGLAAGLAAELSSTFTAWSEESAPAGSTSPPVVGDLPSDAVTVRNVPDQGMSGRPRAACPDRPDPARRADERRRPPRCRTSGRGASRLPVSPQDCARVRPPVAGAAGHGGSGVGGGRSGGPRRDDGVVRACSCRRAGDAVGGGAPAASRPRLGCLGGLQRPRRRHRA